MAFHQMKNNETEAKPDTRRSGEITYNRKGKPVSNSNDPVFAKAVEYDLGNTTKMRYFAATYAGTLYDPNGPYSNRERRINIELKSVTKNTFLSYVSYLETRKEIFFTKANRSFINGN